MAPPKVFATGTTGYIGGDALYTITRAHPDWEITCLVRNSDKGAKVASQYPKVKLVYGDLDAVDVIEEEAKKADIVYHFANCDHVASSEAISKGLAAHTADHPGYWIHTSGSAILVWEDQDKKIYGEAHSQSYNDWDGVSSLTSLPDRALHRDVDTIVLDCAKNNPKSVKTAIVCPPTIYGPGRGPDNQRSNQAYNLAKAILKRGRGFMVNSGKNVWHQIHVQDLSDLYLLLGEAAVQGGGKAAWGSEGYYLAENGAFEWGDIAKAITHAAHHKGFIHSDRVDNLKPEEVTAILPVGDILVGSNSKGESIRAKNLLGWKPHRRSLKNEVPDIVDTEAKALGLVQGHAAKVAS